MDRISAELLKWATRNTDATAAPVEPIDEEWRNAIFSGLDSDSEMLKSCVALIRDDKTAEVQMAEALDQIGYLCEMTPHCKSLVSMRGVQPIVKIIAQTNNYRCLESALKCLATALPNNPDFQNTVISLNGLNIIIEAFMKSQSDADICRHALLCISGMIRNSEYGSKAFVDRHGIEMLLDALSAACVDIRVKRRAVFLLAYLFSSYPASFTSMDGEKAFSRLLKLLDCDDIDMQEKLVDCIHAFLLNAPDARSVADSMGAFKIITAFKMKLIDDHKISPSDEDFATMMDSISNLLAILNE